jgi:hypothetical protein
VSNNLFPGTEHIFKNVIRLSEDLYEKYEQTNTEDGMTLGELFAFTETPAGQEIEKSTQVLKDYMMTLSFEHVKLLQKIMYLGRDREYDEHLIVPSEIYNDFLRTFGKEGWNTQEDEVIFMIGKGDLAKNLKDGTKILGIQL